MKKKTPSARREARKDSRDALIEAALRLFAEKGYEGTTTRDIVEATGLNISLIAYHFGKEGLLDACLEFAARKVTERTAVYLATPPSSAAEFQDRIGLFVQAFLLSHAENPYLHRLVHHELERDSPSFRRVMASVYLKAFQGLVEFFRESQRRGWVRPELDPVTVAIEFNGAMIQQIRFDRLRRELEGKSLGDEKQRQRVARELALIHCSGFMPAI